MLKLPLRYVGNDLMDAEGTRIDRADIIARMGAFDTVALGLELFELHCPRPALTQTVRDQTQAALTVLRGLPRL